MNVIEQFKPILKSIDESMEVFEKVPPQHDLRCLHTYNLLRCVWRRKQGKSIRTKK